MLTNREQLFWIQSTIAFTSIIFMIAIVRPPVENLLKLVVSPFAAISFILFLLFIINKVIKSFDDAPYPLYKIIASFALASVAGFAIYQFIQLLHTAATLDRVVFYASLLIGSLAFLALRVGNLWSMAVMTGIAQGVLIYIIFIL